MNSKILNRLFLKGGGNLVFTNAIIIYGQRLTSALLSLLTTPIVLKALGVEDYGVYVLTVGLVGFLSFINWSLSSATQRFIGYAIGANDYTRLKRIFVTSFSIHLFYGVVILFLIWIFGGIIIEKLLTVPESRAAAAKIVIRYVSIITFLNIITVPFIGLFRARENFFYIAVVGIIESILKLGLAFSLLLYDSDKLIIYSKLLALISLIIFYLNYAISRKFYQEVNFLIGNFDKGLVKEMLGFISWSLLGAIAILSRNQGVSVILNIFFGVVVNAAYGIALQVKYAIGILSQGIIGAISPKIIKSAGAGDHEKMIYLMRSMSKLATISISIIAIPLIIEMPFVLKLWLNIVPPDSILFCRLIIVFCMVMGLSAGIQTAFDAIGKVKVYNIWVSLILLFNLPLAYILFKVNSPAYSIILTGIFLEFCSLLFRLFLLKRYLDYSLILFLKDVILRLLLPILIPLIVILTIGELPMSELVHLIATFTVFFILYPIIVYKVSFDERQKEFIRELVYKVRNLIRLQQVKK